MKKQLIIFFILSAIVLTFLNNFNKLFLTLENHSTKAIELRKLLTRQAAGNNPVPEKGLTKIVLIGDSMTERLGNSDILAKYLSVYYPNRKFLFLNYGYGSTNVLSAETRINQETYHGREFQPIINIDFDTILIESFGNNPLSQYPLPLGLKVQTEALDNIVNTIKTTHPNSKIIFIATVAPNRENYAKNSLDVTQTVRADWVNEREAYIKNHISYAKSHGIPVIDIFDKSADLSGDGDLAFIDQQDYIHPSPKGLQLISEEIATFFYQNRVFAN